jgi:tryptophan-rich sensory protein
MMYVIVFLLSFMVNCFYALYVLNVSHGKTLLAAIFGECVVLCGAIITINYVKDNLLLIPLIVGGFLGTLLSVKISELFKND